MKVLLVDDTKHAIQLFKVVMGLLDNTMQIAGEAYDVEEAIELINAIQNS
jgi:YesN/AraC family two-component response regulator